MPHSQSRWFSPERHADRRPFLLARNRVLAAMRAWFAARDFIEVDCGALQVSPGNEAHLHGFATDLIQPDGSAERRYLHTSPEFACKKLLAAGETRIFNLGHVYRNRERTLTHSPEFTMLEWYRVREDYEVIIEDTLALVRLAAETACTQQFQWRGREAAPLAEAEWLTVNDAFIRYAGVDLLSTLDAEGNADRDKLAGLSPVRIAADDTWSDIFSRILAEEVEANLGNGRITVLYEYPSVEAALARTSSRDPRVAERFELYACGVELANGFGELTDPEEQRRRFEAEMDVKERIYGERYPVDGDLLEALALMPPASGVALGFDRLVMLAAGATRIDQVLWTPVS
ncbi:EF-P lysine aminoacylase EpmA [Aestuariivirga sp.]|uniref:EF-P lysine aminoacylase EpmA n=1 Tax=Aestuariivirga sp. TaxID=2650926 RepID=UPI0035931336